ncbi:MAG: hypothetical protein HYY17_15565, partial [Planctomycetes bacterium]|nr:hypothetical protein [Planctomycetota bacterium]
PDALRGIEARGKFETRWFEPVDAPLCRLAPQEPWVESKRRASRRSRSWRGARGKHRRQHVAALDARREEEVARLRAELLDGDYRPGPYRHFIVREAKPRLISAAPFRDRVVHHALCRVLNPIRERRFIFGSYACRPGKGTHAAADRYQEFSRRARYVLQPLTRRAALRAGGARRPPRSARQRRVKGERDVSKYFPSIDHEILFDEIRRVVGDRRVLDLAGRILRTLGDTGTAPAADAGPRLEQVLRAPADAAVGDEHDAHCRHE